MRLACVIFFLFLGFKSPAAETIPPAPAAYFNDYAHVVSAGTAEQLNRTLEDFERQSSDQIVVAVFPTMQSDSSVEDYTVRVARSWQAGQKDKNNGAILFVFVQEHKMFLQVGYGLEGVLPDALCKRIIDEQISPRFKAGDFDGGLTAGVQAILAAVKGEYKGTGQTVADRQGSGGSGLHFDGSSFGLIILVVIVILFFGGSRTFFPWLLLSSLGSSRNWGGGGGGFSGGNFGGGFSGGNFGGGGAGGSW